MKRKKIANDIDSLNILEEDEDDNLLTRNAKKIVAIAIIIGFLLSLITFVVTKYRNNIESEKEKSSTLLYKLQNRGDDIKTKPSIYFQEFSEAHIPYNITGKLFLFKIANFGDAKKTELHEEMVKKDNGLFKELSLFNMISSKFNKNALDLDNLILQIKNNFIDKKSSFKNTANMLVAYLSTKKNDNVETIKYLNNMNIDRSDNMSFIIKQYIINTSNTPSQ